MGLYIEQQYLVKWAFVRSKHSEKLKKDKVCDELNFNNIQCFQRLTFNVYNMPYFPGRIYLIKKTKTKGCLMLPQGVFLDVLSPQRRYSTTYTKHMPNE